MSPSSNSNAIYPRQPSEVQTFKAPMVFPQVFPVNCCGLITVVFVIASVMVQYKLISWLAIIFCVQSLANMRNMENVSLTDRHGHNFATMGFVKNYFRPTGPALQK